MKEQRNFYKTKSNKMINNARKIENNLNKRLQQYPTIQNPFSLLEQCNEGILNGSHVKWIWIRVWQTLFTNDLRLYQDQIKKKASIREWIRKTICFFAPFSQTFNLNRVQEMEYCGSAIRMLFLLQKINGIRYYWLS